MRGEKFVLTVKQLTILESMRMLNIIYGTSYTPKDIKANLQEEFLKNMSIKSLKTAFPYMPKL